MTANNICCYSNEANDGDVVIEFHASRLDGDHWSDLLGQGKSARLGGLINLGKRHPSGRENGWLESRNRKCGQIVALQNGKEKFFAVPVPGANYSWLIGIFKKNYLHSNCE